MLKPEELQKVLIKAVQGGSFPGTAKALSDAIVGYVMSNGTQVPPTISYTLAPATGAGWAALIPYGASGEGVSDYIISVAIATEFAASTKMIPAAPHPITVPMVFKTSAKVESLKEVSNFEEVWLKIAKGIVDFFSTEIK